MKTAPTKYNLTANGKPRSGSYLDDVFKMKVGDRKSYCGDSVNDLLQRRAKLKACTRFPQAMEGWYFDTELYSGAASTKIDKHMYFLVVTRNN